MTKKEIVQAVVRVTHGWNKEIHEAIEAKISEEFRQSFPNMDNLEKIAAVKKQMREFYYQRMMNTATLLLATSSLLVAFVSVIVALIALRH
ncbi:hypothetical protein LGM46_29320 [Burkholderia arboris]|uniref:hypothetical protein n=1 Tax=Burkholderia arboris TaxID=488730 RepID=UPI001CF45625|nr:hypothetical protein [Burkholderia arboris]MCA8037072.1 hypothetical protein [Burkholderia arboris]